MSAPGVVVVGAGPAGLSAAVTAAQAGLAVTVIDERSAARLRARIVCGAANNVLATDADGDRLADRGVLYAPDYVVNSGGVIQVADEYRGYVPERARTKATAIFETTRSIFAAAAEEGVPPAVAADRLAERRMAEVGRLRGILVPGRDR